MDVINIKESPDISFIEFEFIQIQLQFILHIFLQPLVPHTFSLIRLSNIRVIRALAHLHILLTLHQIISTKLKIHEILILFFLLKLLSLFLLISPALRFLTLFLEIRILSVIHWLLSAHHFMHDYLRQNSNLCNC